MEYQMLRFPVCFPPKMALAAAAGLMLSGFAPVISYAASGGHHGHSRNVQHAAEPDTRAQFPNASDYPYSTDNPNACIGGYRWIQHFDDANLTPAQTEVPVRCR
jgi:hypothetical protein